VASPGARTAPPPKKEEAPPKKDEENTSTEAEDEVGVFGLHPQAERGIIWGPLIVFGTCMILATPMFKDTTKSVILHLLDTWVFFTAPLEKLIIQRTGLFVALAAASSLAPLMIFMVINALRAASDIEQNMNSWQYIAMVFLLLASLATFLFTGQLNPTLEKWAAMTAPLEKLLIANTDTILLGMASLIFVPVIASLGAFLLRCMFGRKISVSIDFEEDMDAKTGDESEAEKSDS